jgi:outer membrane protein OmpA-like peptidoglycan-associated protein
MPWYLVVGILLLVVTLLWRPWRLLSIAILFVMLSSNAHALEPVPVDNYRPALTFSDYWSTYSNDVLPNAAFSARVQYNYASDLLRLKEVGGDRLDAVLKDRHTLDVIIGLGVMDRLDVGFVLPIGLAQNAGTLVPIDGAANQGVSGDIGDLSIVAKGLIWKHNWFSLGAVLPITLPTGSTSNLMGRGVVSVQPAITLSGKFSRLSLASNIGLQINPSRNMSLANTQLDKDVSLTASLAAKIHVTDRVDFVSDLFGSASFDRIAAGQSDMEWINGVRGRVWRGLYAEAGFGVGLADGVGSPAYRGLAGLGFDFGWAPAQAVRKAIPEQTKPCPPPVTVVAEPKTRIIMERATIILPKFYFDFDKDTVMAQSQPLLDEVAALLKDPSVVVHKILVKGHADARGSDEYNMDLARRRAQRVIDELVARGVNRELFVLRSHGERMPVAPNDSQDNMAKNRRVELVVLSVEETEQ